MLQFEPKKRGIEHSTHCCLPSAMPEHKLAFMPPDEKRLALEVHFDRGLAAAVRSAVVASREAKTWRSAKRRRGDVRSADVERREAPS